MQDYFRPSPLANVFAPSCIRPDIVVFKRDNLIREREIEIRPVLNSHADNEGERAEYKRRENISIYTVKVMSNHFYRIKRKSNPS